MNNKEKFFKFLAGMKFRYDVGGVVLTLVNFSLLVTANSEKILNLFGVWGWNIISPYATLILALVSVPLGLSMIMIFGELLVRFQFYKHFRQEVSGKDPVLAEILERVKRIEDKNG